MSTMLNPSAPRPSWGAKWLATGALLLAPLSFSCQDTAVASSNLDALLYTNNHLQHYTAVQSGWKYYLSTLIDPRLFGANSASWFKEKQQINDPAYLALENLLVLAEGVGAREAHRNVIQVRQFSRFATRSPGALVRERAILELASHARRLKIRDLSSVLISEEDAEPMANAAELSTLLAGLIETTEPVLFESYNATATQLSDFKLACEQFEVHRIEIEGLWRLLKAIETYAARVDLMRDDLAPLLNLSDRLQRRAIALALANGSIDPIALVRSAALQANFEAFGPPVLKEALSQLRGESTQDRSPLFGLVASYIAEDPVASQLYSLLAANGWPQYGLADSAEARFNRLKNVFASLGIVHDRARFGSKTRLKVLQAMVILMPDGPQSLREEDWTTWWWDWSKDERIELKRLSDEAGGAPQS